MATSNTENQRKFYSSKVGAGESKISCWLPEDDNKRLQQLMELLGYSGKGKKQKGYTQVISQALKELEINLTPPPERELVRYGLRNIFHTNHGILSYPQQANDVIFYERYEYKNPPNMNGNKAYVDAKLDQPDPKVKPYGLQ